MKKVLLGSNCILPKWNHCIGDDGLLLINQSLFGRNKQYLAIKSPTTKTIEQLQPSFSFTHVLFFPFVYIFLFLQIVKWKWLLIPITWTNYSPWCSLHFNKIISSSNIGRCLWRIIHLDDYRYFNGPQKLK